MTLALSIIVKDETESLIRLNESIQLLPLNQKIAVFTGTNEATKSLLEYLGFKVFDFKWTDDFSEARNFSKSKVITDWMLWLDADDVVENPESIWREIAEADSHDCNAIFAEYVYDTNCPVSRERIVKTNDFEWRGALHESLYPLEREKRYLSNKFKVWHHYTDKSLSERQTRNFAISKKAFEKNPNSHTIYAYASSAYESHFYDDAIALYRLALQYSATTEYQYIAHCRIAYSYMFRNNERKCIKWCNRALELYPEIGEAMWIKAMCMMRLKRWTECIDYCKSAMQLKEPENWNVIVNKNIYRTIGPDILMFAVKKLDSNECGFPERSQLAFKEIYA